MYIVNDKMNAGLIANAFTALTEYLNQMSKFVLMQKVSITHSNIYDKETLQQEHEKHGVAKISVT